MDSRNFTVIIFVLVRGFMSFTQKSYLGIGIEKETGNRMNSCLGVVQKKKSNF